jgi:regulator of sigma E protease
MVPRLRVASVLPKAPAYGQVLPGDVIEAVVQQPTHLLVKDPSHEALTEAVNGAGQQDQSVILTVCNSWGANSHDTAPIVPNFPIANDRKGMGVALAYDERNTVVADVQPDSPAQKAGITPGSRITKVDGQSVSTWFDVRALLSQATANQRITIDATTADGKKSFAMTLSQDQIDSLKFLTLTSDLSAVLRERTEIRKTSNPIVAAGWGISETRDFVLQFYVTIRRMFTGSVSYKQAMGPVGIVRFGAASAARGMDWLVWFLAMISANLAVVNFLPIPIVDGGLFVLLILEAVQGKPLSPSTQKIIQFVGLALILSVFLLVTYQDITRPFGHG